MGFREKRTIMLLDKLFFTQTLLGKPVDTVGIWLSGGADSSLLCYMIANKIIQENHKIKIQPVSIQKRPGELTSAVVLTKIKELLNADNIFKDHIMYKTPDDWLGDEYHSLFKKKHHEHLKNKNYDLIYSGITSNTAKEEQLNLGQTIDEGIENIRGVDITKQLIYYSIFVYNNELREEIEVRPFFNINKKEIAEKYKELGLLDTLFPLTKSCEDRTVLNGHCGKCWWCLERKWAFGTL
jgi:tRNA(Ile)-lysidine synthase TilS/MesJ